MYYCGWRNNLCPLIPILCNLQRGKGAHTQLSYGMLCKCFKSVSMLGSTSGLTCNLLDIALYDLAKGRSVG
jgi:hypothetical protein